MISVDREYDEDVIRSVLMNEKILDAISEDGDPSFDVDVDASCFISLKVRDTLAGVFILDPKSSVELDLHAQILPEHRAHSRDFMALIYQWIIDNTEYEKVTGECPVIYPQVIKFCTDCGMVEEGTNRRSWLKGGEIHDQTRIGITKDEIISFLGGRK